MPAAPAYRDRYTEEKKEKQYLHNHTLYKKWKVHNVYRGSISPAFALQKNSN